jgi:peroxiredoxin
LRDEKTEWDKRSFADVYTITTGTPADTAEFCREFEVPFPCLVDYPGEPAYAAFGLAKVSLRQLFGPSLVESMIVIAKRLREIRAPKSGDVYQMSGAFVFDSDGILRFAHANQHPNDNADSERIWACLDSFERD